MASAQLIQELYQTARQSSFFQGLSDEEVLKACQAYQDRPDTHILTAIKNMVEKDQAILEEAKKKEHQIENSQKKIAEIHQQEIKDRQKDDHNADQILAELFK